jgi:hypothetical protein
MDEAPCEIRDAAMKCGSVVDETSDELLHIAIKFKLLSR